MEKIIRNLESYAPSVLRIGMSAVMLWFSFNALFELAFGVLMLFGIQTRVAAFLLAIHLFDIMYVVGYGEIGVRDLGLAIATLVVAMNGPDRLSIDQRINNQNII
jgi:uncharacterized membrane protein YphA (DoxX/SURF4 family)